ncbi:MAG: DciA family protein [Aestuariivita sp.]|nr:DciA family protein [Aestuariivita sp.]MCY4202368.1 DciA family protein [Aestuariivita sp.]MCY4288344.1 DciA family protein [Aestuariivita sp.]MCY4346411.1 DciA family protein [Aestuariivita sp.]
MGKRESTTHGFKHAASFLQSNLRRVGESRGFSTSKILTRWEEIAGSDLSKVSRPIDVKFTADGFGATLRILVSGAHAPMIEMQKEGLKQRVNEVYGFNAISRIRFTQTAAEGFTDGMASFLTESTTPSEKKVDPKVTKKVRKFTNDIQDDKLRSVLDLLGTSVLTQDKGKKT